MDKETLIQFIVPAFLIVFARLLLLPSHRPWKWVGRAMYLTLFLLAGVVGVLTGVIHF